MPRSSNRTHWLRCAACKAGHAEAVEYLCGVPGVDLDLADCEGECPLLAACAEGHAPVVKVHCRLAERMLETVQ